MVQLCQNGSSDFSRLSATVKSCHEDVRMFNKIEKGFECLGSLRSQCDQMEKVREWAIKSKILMVPASKLSQKYTLNILQCINLKMRRSNKSVQTDTITITETQTMRQRSPNIYHQPLNYSWKHEPQKRRRLGVGDLIVKTVAQVSHLRQAARAIYKCQVTRDYEASHDDMSRNTTVRRVGP